MKHKVYSWHFSAIKKISINLLIITFGISCKNDIGKNPNNSRERQSRLTAYTDLNQEEKLSPENATLTFNVSDGLGVKLFASEPMVVNPTNMDIDPKGRVWVLESPDYSKSEGKGRIKILEDTDSDGEADKSTLFYEGEDVNIALGIAVLGDKVYVTRSPNVLVFTDKNHDDIPDKKEILFQGLGKMGDHSAHAITFGPDGKFYWNMGNRAGPVLDANGKQINDIYGRPLIQDGKDFIGGMILRCNPDGTEFEVLGHNFRNNYEVSVDSYGNIWQSDNDDDGNQSCRINYILEHGNYGYLDEITRESWSAHRTNIEATIPKRHWHQNDPGVVPNLLITGAGSPAGILSYEGQELPDKFRGELVHADAGPNTIRTYPVRKEGAGLSASVKNLLVSDKDKWFRPVDVTTAPDGSIFVADWYDPGVGGGAASDFERGRIFRISNDPENYKIAEPHLKKLPMAISALKSPNISTRYRGWTALFSLGEAAEAELMKMYNGTDPVYRARALWLLSKIKGKEREYICLGIKDKDPNIQITAVRAAKQADMDFVPLIKNLVENASPEVAREIAIGLYRIKTAEAVEIWSKLALRYTSGERWYLEALGIGASDNWDNCFRAYSKKLKDKEQMEYRDIVWRSRTELALPVLTSFIKNHKVQGVERLRYFRAFDFLQFETKQGYLLDLLDTDHPDKENIRMLALQHIDPKRVGMTTKLKIALDRTLKQIYGTSEYLNLVDKYRIKDERSNLLKLCIANENHDLGGRAVKILLGEGFNGADLLRSSISKSMTNAENIIECLARVKGSRQSLDILSDVVLGEMYSLDIKKQAINAMGNSWSGETRLLECVKTPQFDTKLSEAAGSVLFNVYRSDIQEEAEKYLTRPGKVDGKALPAIRDLISNVGDVKTGEKTFAQNCATCHVIGESGVNFGPDLSQIGDKLSREGLYNAVIYPDQAINYDYEGVVLTLKDGSSAMGIVESETEEFLELRMMGGTTGRFPKSDIKHRENTERSLMPNLSTVLGQEELADLVEYLTTLKK